MNSHEFGRYVEDLFEEECRFRGIAFEKCHPHLPFDFFAVVAGNQLTVQVKGVRSLLVKDGKRNRRVFRVKAYRKTQVHQNFHDAGISLMAIFVEPFKRWHILPPPNIRGKIEISRNPTGRMFHSIDRWDLLGGSIVKSPVCEIVKTCQTELFVGPE